MERSILSTLSCDVAVAPVQPHADARQFRSEPAIAIVIREQRRRAGGGHGAD